MVSHESVFSRIYGTKAWGSGSGSGSQVASTRPYRQLLGRLLGDWPIRNVVDLGCGDWAFSRLIDWGDVDYLGIDVVPAIVRANRRRYGSLNVRFAQADFRRGLPAKADLYLVKDVLQHWTGGEISRFLRRMGGRRMLITNTTAPGPYWELERTGGYRPLDLREAPFHVVARELLRYRAGADDTKVVLLVSG